MSNQEAYERRTFNEYDAECQAAEDRSEAIEMIAGEIAADIEAALKSGADIQSRVYPGAKQSAVRELSDWAQEYDDVSAWIRRALAGVSVDEIRAEMIAGYADSFAEAEFDAECERNAAEAEDYRREERDFDRGVR